MKANNPDWTAPRTNQDWRDDELMLAVAWLKSFVPRKEMEQRLDVAKTNLLAAQDRMRAMLPYVKRRVTFAAPSPTQSDSFRATVPE